MDDSEYNKLARFVRVAANDLDWYGDAGQRGRLLLTRFFKGVLDLVRYLTGQDPTEVQGKAVIQRGPNQGRTLSTIFATSSGQAGVMPITWTSFNKDRKGLSSKGRSFLAEVDKQPMPPRLIEPSRPDAPGSSAGELQVVSMAPPTH